MKRQLVAIILASLMTPVTRAEESAPLHGPLSVNSSKPQTVYVLTAKPAKVSLKTRVARVFRHPVSAVRNGVKKAGNGMKTVGSGIKKSAVATGHKVIEWNEKCLPARSVAETALTAMSFWLLVRNINRKL